MVDRDPKRRPTVQEILDWDSLFVAGMKEMVDLIQFIHEWMAKHKLTLKQAINHDNALHHGNGVSNSVSANVNATNSTNHSDDHNEHKETNDEYKWLRVAYGKFIRRIARWIEVFPEMDPKLFALAVPFVIEDIPIWTAEALLDYFKMLWAVAAKLTEELCCCLLREPLLRLFARSTGEFVVKCLGFLRMLENAWGLLEILVKC